MWETLNPPGPEQAAEYYAAGWWRSGTFLDDLARWARDRPDHPAIISYQGGRLARSVSYRDLAALTARFAAALAELGVGQRDVVVPYLPNSWLLAPLYLACMRIGAVAAPAQPALAGRELGHILAASGAKACVTVDRFGGTDYDAILASVAPGTLEHRIVVGDAARTGAIGFTEFLADTPWEQRHPDPGQPAGPDDPALLVYTSGTTGQPKGVVHSANTLYAASQSLSVPYQLTCADVISIPQFLTHVAAGVHAVFAPIFLGGTCVTHDTNDDMDLMLDLVSAHHVSHLHAAPWYLARLLAAQQGRPRDTASLRVLSSSSAPISAQLVAQAREVLGLPLFAVWGMTETGGCTTTGAADPPDWAAHSDGRPMPWMHVRVAAPDAAGTGRLLVRGASLCLGYLGQPGVFAGCVDADGWLDTGDMARADGRGGIRITGRRADLITRATGNKVPALEIETVLSRHPAIGEVVLIGYPDPRIPGSDEVCAVVVPEGEPPTLEEVQDHLKEQQVTYENWPDQLLIVAGLPKNSLGKVLRAQLREQIERLPARPSAGPDGPSSAAC